ncbi:chain-length determining protein, partial [Pandoraea pneumonica]
MAELETGGDGPADVGQSAPVGPALSRADVLIALREGADAMLRVLPS